jgi:Protein of unknown function (DUF3106)
MTRRLKNGIATVASFLLAVGLSMPAEGQHPKQEQRREQHQATQQRLEAPRPPRQERTYVRAERPAEHFPARSTAPAYAPRNQGHSPAYSQGRQEARPPENARPGNRPATFSEQGSQPHREVPRPPARGEEQRNAQRVEQSGQVARPPAGAARSETTTNGPPRSQEVARPPESLNTRREVPRPPSAAQRHGGDWLRTHRDLPPAEQQKALQNDPQFRKLPPQQQQRLVNRLNNFNSLSPQAQQQRLNRIETWEHLTPQQKSQARQLASQWQQLPAQRKQVMKTAIGDLRAMPPDQRERVLESDRFRGMFSDQERNMLRETTKLPLAPAVPRPPQE